MVTSRIHSHIFILLSNLVLVFLCNNIPITQRFYTREVAAFVIGATNNSEQSTSRSHAELNTCEYEHGRELVNHCVVIERCTGRNNCLGERLKSHGPSITRVRPFVYLFNI